MRLEETAKIVARVIHKDQKYGELPYFTHLQAVVEIIERYSDNPFVIAAGWLHDADEDTTYKVADIGRDFGAIVAGMVDAVSSGLGNRHERTTRMYSKLLAGHPEACIIKVADRLTNMEASMSTNPSLYAMYQRELPRFYQWMLGKVPPPMHQELGLFYPPSGN